MFRIIAVSAMSVVLVAGRARAEENKALTELTQRLAALPGEMAKNTNEEMARVVYGLTLKRTPSADEMKTMLRHLATAKDREGASRDVVWALVNTKEFMKAHGITKVEEMNRIAEIISKPARKK